jgi:hypothetical protein
MPEIMDSQLPQSRRFAQLMEQPIDVARFDVAAMCGGEDQPGVAPLRACLQTLFVLAFAVFPQNGD